jgi:hypothetical protein
LKIFLTLFPTIAYIQFAPSRKLDSQAPSATVNARTAINTSNGPCPDDRGSFLFTEGNTMTAAQPQELLTDVPRPNYSTGRKRRKEKRVAASNVVSSLLTFYEHRRRLFTTTPEVRESVFSTTEITAEPARPTAHNPPPTAQLAKQRALA